MQKKGDTFMMDNRRLTDVPSPRTGACSPSEGTIVVKTEPVEYDGQESVWDKMESRADEETGAEFITVKTEILEDEPEQVSDSVGAENNATAELDLEENLIVMNKNTKFRSKAKPDTSTYSQICQICNMAFRWPQQLKDHIVFEHEGNFPYTCKVCGKGFKQLRLLKVHEYVHTDERPHCCQLCPSRFKIKAGLTKHMRVTHGEDSLKFKCEHCSKVFKCREHLVNHLAVHQSEQKVACEICGKIINHKRSLKDHLITHSKERNFECTTCGMKFKRKYSLKLHRMNHMEVRPYRCDFCVKSFSVKSRLKRHLELHIEDRRYNCGFCDKSFTRTHDLKRHLEVHTAERPYKCQHCEKSFKQLRDLQVHEKRHQVKIDLECRLCGREFETLDELTDHKKTHTVEKRHKCPFCSFKAKKCSDLKVHFRVHTGERPYKCDLCPYRGKTLTTFKRHRMTHERNTVKAGEVEVDEKETDFKTEGLSQNNGAMRENSNSSSETEVEGTIEEAVQSGMKFKEHIELANDNLKVAKLLNGTQTRSSEQDEREESVVVNNGTRQGKTHKRIDARNTVLNDENPERDTRADVKSGKSCSSEVDDVVHSGVVVAESEDFVVVKNEIF